VPGGVEVEVETVRVAVIVCPDPSVTLAGLTESPGPDGDIDADRVTVPEKPLTLVTLRVDVACGGYFLELLRCPRNPITLDNLRNSSPPAGPGTNLR
jgi:hypothetical protein